MIFVVVVVKLCLHLTASCHSSRYSWFLFVWVTLEGDQLFEMVALQDLAEISSD